MYVLHLYANDLNVSRRGMISSFNTQRNRITELQVLVARIKFALHFFRHMRCKGLVKLRKCHGFFRWLDNFRAQSHKCEILYAGNFVEWTQTVVRIVLSLL